MGAPSRMATVELLEVPASPPRGPEAPARGPRSRRRVPAWLLGVLVLSLLGGAIGSTELRGRAARAEARERLVAAGTFLADVGPGVRVRWRETGPRAEVLAVADGVVVTISESHDAQLLVARSLEMGAELWRSTFALRLGSSRCLAPERSGEAAVLVCALRARPRIPGRDEGGTSLHVRELGSGELLAERRAAEALVGARLVDGDLVGAWFSSGSLEVRREDAVTGERRWSVPLELLEELGSPSAAQAHGVAGQLVVATDREAFAVSEDGSVALERRIAPPRQARRSEVLPLAGGLFVVTGSRERAHSELVDADGRVRLAAIGVPLPLLADDGSLGPVVLADHPDGDLLWQAERREKLWRGSTATEAGIVTGGVLAVESPLGVRVMDPRRRVPLWTDPEARLVGVGRQLVTLSGGALVGTEAPTGLEIWREPVELAEGARLVVVGGELFALEPGSIAHLGS